jgi:hypothetical protein
MSEYRFSSGLPGLDSILEEIREGDNVVFQVEDIGKYLPFVHPFCRWAEENGKPVVYFRFAPHEPVIPAGVEHHLRILHPEAGFELFISEIFREIEQFGYGACYVFDCLSELSTDWYSDRMLGNFFRLTCPYLYDYKTVAYFALLRNRHDSSAVSAIQNTAQIVLDLYRYNDRFYLHPLKVDGRSSPTMYFLHAWEDASFIPVTDSATISEILSKITRSWTDFTVNRQDLWLRTFQSAGDLLAREGADTCPPGLKTRLLKMLLTREERLLKLAENHFNSADLVALSRRMIGTGLVGGKTAGMLLARNILIKQDDRYREILEVHDSFFIGTHVFYTFIIENGCWWDRHRLKGSDFTKADTSHIQAKILRGDFPDEIRAQFVDMLQYFGQSPIIVRSSSLLEDAYGNAFSGKYDSVFCPNQGSPEERLAALQDAIRTVYASTLSRDALVYRSRRGLSDQDEQMGILIQRVSGAFYGQLYFPQVAGVGFSFNPYVWNRDIDPEAGMVRLVFGLGTRAVDRSDDDYTLLVALNAPKLRVEGLAGKGKRYRQRRVDLLDLEKRVMETADFSDIAGKTGDFNRGYFSVADEAADSFARERGLEREPARELSFEALLDNETFIDELRLILSRLQEAYENPVDVEFTVNFKALDRWKLNLVQCRPFQVRNEILRLENREEVQGDRILLKTPGPVIGPSAIKKIDMLIHVIPDRYGSLPVQERHAVARLIGRLCRLDELEGKTLMLSGPGRWATSMPELGIPVSFSEISRAAVLCEIAKMHEGLVPDVSLGTHFFNDLVELEMIYLALYPDGEGSVFAENRLAALENHLERLLPDEARYGSIVRVIIPGKDDQQIILSADSFRQEGVCYLSPSMT